MNGTVQEEHYVWTADEVELLLEITLEHKNKMQEHVI